VLCELNDGVALIPACHRILGKFDTLNVTEWAEPLKNFKKYEVAYLSDVSLADLVEDLDKATNIDFVIVIFLGIGWSGAAQGTGTLNATLVNFLFKLGSSCSSVFLSLRSLDHDSLSHQLGT
jgi:hypothetical protein